MIIQESTFTLKDGRTAVIRSAKPEEGAALLEFLHTVTGETEFLIRYPEETEQYTAENETAFIERENGGAGEAMPIALIDGKIVACCQVSWEAKIKTGHRATIAISILKECWGQGLGARLMEELIRIAEGNERILQLELDFIEGNSRARALYEKMGFRITGVKQNAIRLKDGTFRNEYMMIREIRRES